MESLRPPPSEAWSSATSPGEMPVSGAWNWLPFGQNDGNSSFHTAIASYGVTSVSASDTLYVFCHIFPKPWIGDSTCLPPTVSSAPCGTFEAASESTGFAQFCSSRDTFSVPIAPPFPQPETAASASASFAWIATASSSLVSSKIWR